MAAPALDLDRTARDFDAADDRLWSLFQSVFPNLGDRNRNNLVNMLRWAMADRANDIDYYQARLLRQAFIGTCTDRRWMIALGRRTGYTMSGATAATCDLTVTLENGPLAGDVTIPAGTQVTTQDATGRVVGETQAALTITAGNTTGTVGWKHAQSRTLSFVSTELANQEQFLPAGPILEDSVSFTSGLGAWTKEDTLAYSAGTDRDFTLSVDQNDRGTVKFGDDVNGAIPDGSFTIYYEIGGGASGNVDAATLTRLVGTFSDTFGTAAVLSVTNAAAASGGSDRETVNAARQLMPLSVSASRASITREDFEIHALEVPGVSRALMLSADEASFVPENEGRLYVVPSGGGTASSALLDAVETAVTTTYPPPITFRTIVLSASYLTIDVLARIWVREGYSPTAVKSAVQAALTAWFSPDDADGSANENVDFGYNFKDADGLPAGEVAWSDIHNAVRDVAGVRKVGAGLDDFTLNGAHADLSIANHQFPALGTVTLVNGDTGTVI